MKNKNAVLKVMTKMALADGEISADERDYILPFLNHESELDGLVQTVQTESLEQMLSQVDSYADRFFIALRAASMAHIDQHFDEFEAQLYQKLLGLLNLEQGDLGLIEDYTQTLYDYSEFEPSPRFQELYTQSSFSA